MLFPNVCLHKKLKDVHRLQMCVCACMCLCVRLYVWVFATYRGGAMHVLSCQWLPLTYTQEDKHTPDCLHLCARGRWDSCVCVYTHFRLDVCVRAYIRARLCLCFLRINNAIRTDYESAEQTDTDCAQRTCSQTKTHTELRLWINVRMQDDNSASDFLGQDGYAWPQSIHMENAVGEWAGHYRTDSTWAVTRSNSKQNEQLAGVAWLK